MFQNVIRLEVSDPEMTYLESGLNPASTMIPVSLMFEVNLWSYLVINERRMPLTFFPSNASIKVMVFSIEPKSTNAPLKENLRNFISGVSSKLKMLKGF